MSVERRLEPFVTTQDFFNFLWIDPLPHRVTTETTFSFDKFVDKAEAMAESMHKFFPNKPILKFKDTGAVIPRGRVTDNECQPDITAAFEGDWIIDKPLITLWQRIRLAGERESKGRSRDAQKQAITHLHYILLARPDLHVAQGLLTREDGITFLLGIGGYGVRSFEVPWASEDDVYRLMYAFVYRLYMPGPFADLSYVNMVPDLERGIATYTVRIIVTDDDGVKRPIECPDFKPIYASNPFGTRTHVLANPISKVQIRGQTLMVLKDQLCRVTRFDEHEILAHIHAEGKVPGVVEGVHHESIMIPSFFPHSEERYKHRIGLVQFGRGFSSISTPRKMLQIAYDSLEVMRYLRVHRKVIHRDLSEGNIAYTGDGDTPVSAAGSVSIPDAGPGDDEGMPLCFVEYLLGKSEDPRKTSALLIDFNHAEHLEGKQGLAHNRTNRTGTPIFIARAVEMGTPVPVVTKDTVPAIPNSPAPYAVNHPDRIVKFPPDLEELVIGVSAQSDSHQWRHELDHDVESIFWVIFYWLVCAAPVEHPAETINRGTWAKLITSVSNRIEVMFLLSHGYLQDGTIHSFYRPVQPLLAALAAILVVDRSWVKESDVRSDVEYTCEACQRLILQFLLDNPDEGFLDHKVGSRRRVPQPLPHGSPTTKTTGQTEEECRD